MCVFVQKTLLIWIWGVVCELKVVGGRLKVGLAWIQGFRLNKLQIQ